MSTKIRYGAGLLLLCLLLFVLCPAAFAAGGKTWTWLSSNDKYSKFYAPASVHVTQEAKARGTGKNVATEIEAEIKTSFSYEGADETIRNYKIGHVIPNPGQLAYAVAQVRVSPQNRTLQYLGETFYDAAGKVLWSKGKGTEKEMNSQQFDEEFYAAIVDAVFYHGEMKRVRADDRWIVLWSDESSVGIKTQVTADTSTMRRVRDNLIFWAWTEVRDAEGKAIEIKFDKRAVNLPQGTERIVTGRYWTSKEGWQPLDDGYEGAYRMIARETPEERGLIRLRAFAKGYSTWVTRYQVQ